jgi:hypothetical protein
LPPTLTTRWVASAGTAASWRSTLRVTAPSTAASVARQSRREPGPDLLHDIRMPGHIDAVVEDRIAEKDHVTHEETAPAVVNGGSSDGAGSGSKGWLSRSLLTLR